jgi:hypothetical protein
MTEPADRGVRLRMLLSFLEVIRAQVKQRNFKPRQASEIETLYHNDVGWRQARLLALLRLFKESFGPGAEPQDPELEEILRKNFGPRESAGEPQYQELLRLLEEEIASVREEFEYAERQNEERAAIERDACLAPEGETWRMMLRQEAALDRSIDRKVRILMRLRKESASLPSAPAGQDDDGTKMESVEEVLDRDISSRIFPSAERMEASKMNDRCGNVHENKGLLWKTAPEARISMQTNGLSSLRRECC